jgi:thiol-disulfide isomerase/thioredoxin
MPFPPLRTLALCLCTALLPALAHANDAKPTLPASPGFVELQAADTALAPLLQAEAAKAREQGRKPFVYFYADWCGPCKRLRASLNDPKMVDAFSGTHIIALNYDNWKDKIKATNFKVKGFPAFYALNDKAESTGRRIDGGAWEADTPDNMAPPLKAFFRQ